MIGKRQIILAALMVTLGAAVYLNWVFSSDPTKDLNKATDATTKTSSLQSLGDALYVGSTSIEGADKTLTATSEEYFAAARLSRKKTRDEALSVMQSTIATAKDATVKQAAAESVLQLAKNIEEEGRIENLVLAKGFPDCMAYVDSNTVNVVVATPKDGLTPAQAAQVYDIARNETAISPENIKVIEMK